MTTPSAYHTFRKDSPWDTHRASPESCRPRSRSRNVALPSIRQTFPDLHLESSLVQSTADRPSEYVSSSSGSGLMASPDYVHSPNSNKKRRVSNENEPESLRAKQIPRLYPSPEQPLHHTMSPHRDQAHSLSSKETWATSPASRNSPYGSGSSVPSADLTRHVEIRQSLPSLTPSVKYERDSPVVHGTREFATDLGNGTRAIGPISMAPSLERPPYQTQDYGGYGYQHPPRFQSLSTSSIRPHERGPFSAGAAYGSHYRDMSRYGDMGMGGDAKQRKRRGNLPKETTDKLRAWFVAHLQHPYPTEDEKQDLMRQTGLQMNQISNWFINARRRQLPTMINNARAESDAMNGRSSVSGDGSILASTEHGPDYGNKRDDGLPLSDSEGGAYDDDMSKFHRRRGANLQRESV
ncbi:homeodomain-containing protein [Moelleriella libera RCEF 2490]|uniref:Homeodomain-containing protein n=1 Tax=Moelleriella libera RCEF 2490 TaxID=1081109 RepID=A0A168BGR9_9HYPO|nr:homeodomain-containing protein [Moelleriella libera RCEF 2490]